MYQPLTTYQLLLFLKFNRFYKFFKYILRNTSDFHIHQCIHDFTMTKNRTFFTSYQIYTSFPSAWSELASTPIFTTNNNLKLFRTNYTKSNSTIANHEIYLKDSSQTGLMIPYTLIPAESTVLTIFLLRLWCTTNVKADPMASIQCIPIYQWTYAINNH